MSAPLPPHVSKGPGLVAVTWVEATIGLLLLVARLYTRARIVRSVGWDDWIMVLATVSYIFRYPVRLLTRTQALAIVTSGIVTQMVHYGVGQHAAYIDPPNLINAVKWIWLSTPFSTMSACFGKVSIALLLMRILGTRKKRYTYFLWVLIVLLILINIFLSVITFAQCTPVAYLWDQLNPMVMYKGKCWDPNIQKYYGYFQGGKSNVPGPCWHLSKLIH
jgi:cell division protein FtsW (lipid II flippase)